MRPPESASSVCAAIAVAAGVRAATCTTEVPSRIRDVCAARNASGVNASEPYASALHTESKPSFSASCTRATGGTSAAPAHSRPRPSFMAAHSGRPACFRAHQAARDGLDEEWSRSERSGTGP
jgi:hypothetical protein